ncbi:hypothetical protein FACS1894176_08480 [Bacteroidia bacterium]|nr:hypothetical protein FACS1894176_08480 [Bacteroidia bacterium]
MKQNKLLFLLSIILIQSCSDEKQTFFSGTLKTIRFEKEYAVTGEHVNVDSIGIKDVTVMNDFLIAGVYKQPYFAQIYDLKTLSFIGNFFYKGAGPNDFGYIDIIKKEYPYIWVQDRMYQNVRMIDLKESILNNQTVIKNEMKYLDVVEPLNAFYVNDTCLLIKSFDTKKGLHYFRYNPVNAQLRHDVSMYNYPITSDILYTKMTPLSDCMKPDGSKIASLSGILDQIDILDITHPQKSISVTTTNHQYDYNYINNTNSDDMQTFYFSYPYCSDNLIFALYKNNDTKQKNNIELHIIDWNGNPLYKLLLDREIEFFTIDFDNGFMYGTSPTEERVYRYYIEDMINLNDK